MRITEVPGALLAAARAPETVQDPRPGRRPWTGPTCLVLLLVGMLAVVVVRNGISAPDLSPPALLVASTVLSWLPLLLRVRRPRRALVGTVAVESLHIALLPVIDPGVQDRLDLAAYQPVPLATMAAAWAVASRTSRGWAWGVAGATTLLAVGLATRPLDLLVTDLVMFNLVLIVTGAGAWATARRERAQRRAREQQEQARRLVTDERLRIARDLHDVLAHNLALVDAQAGIAAYLVRTDPATAATALDDMAEHTRQALNGLRAAVGLLRHDDAPGAELEPGGRPDLIPPPDPGRFDELLAPIRAAGTAVSLDVTGTPRPLGPSGDVATYRIVQEALTNATKHAPGAPVAVTLDWFHDRLEIGVENGPPPVPPVEPAAGSGHGLVGMRERALACNGTLDVDRLADGGFVVRASIPTSPQGRTGP